MIVIKLILSVPGSQTVKPFMFMSVNVRILTIWHLFDFVRYDVVSRKQIQLQCITLFIEHIKIRELKGCE